MRFCNSSAFRKFWEQNDTLPAQILGYNLIYQGFPLLAEPINPSNSYNPS